MLSIAPSIHDNLWFVIASGAENTECVNFPPTGAESATGGDDKTTSNRWVGSGVFVLFACRCNKASVINADDFAFANCPILYRIT